MATKLGHYWQGGYHKDGRDEEIMRVSKPVSIRVLSIQYRNNPALAEKLFAWTAGGAANGLVLFRDVDLTNQHEALATQDPIALGRAHAQVYINDVAAWRSLSWFDASRLVFTGLNEPDIDPRHAGAIDRAVKYNIAFAQTLNAVGLKAGIGNFSVGWPHNNDWAGNQRLVPDWKPFQPLYPYLTGGKNYLVVHEYWAEAGPQENWGWWCGRYRAIPWQDVKIIIGEAGMDLFVKYGPNFPGVRGWGGIFDWARHVSVETYLQQIRDYGLQLQLDPRVVTYMIFTWDHSDEWKSFDVRCIREQLLQKMLFWHSEAKTVAHWPMPYVTTLRDELIRVAKANQLISPNPGAALEKTAYGNNVIRAAIGNEFKVIHSGITYVGQLFYLKDASKVSERVYYCKLGDWGNVKTELVYEKAA